MNAQPTPAPGRTVRVVVIGGFLGAGKTRLGMEFGDFLRKKKLSVGIITNDHGTELVDSATFRAGGFRTEEIRNGAFSMQFDAFVQAARRFEASGQPEVLIVEPVGTATDLVATLTQPLRQMHGAEYSIAPLSVIVDPIRAARILGLESGGTFSDKVVYLYRKQLEEADLIVINKTDLVSAQKIGKLRKALEELNPGASILLASALDRTGLEEWFQCLMTTDQPERNATELDYAISSQAEALLGWLNCTVNLSSVKYFDAGKILVDLATALQSLLKQEGVEGAHLKMVLSHAHDPADVAVLSLVRTDDQPRLSREVSEPIQRGEMIINVRAEANPEILHETVNRALLGLMERSPELFARMQHCEHFRPGTAKPTHRIATLARS